MYSRLNINIISGVKSIMNYHENGINEIVLNY